MLTTGSTQPVAGGFCTRGMRNSKFLVLTGVLMIIAGIVTNTLVYFHIGYPMMAFGAFIVLMGLVRMRREKPAFMMASGSPCPAPHQMVQREPIAQHDHPHEAAPYVLVGVPPPGLLPEGQYLPGSYSPPHGEGYQEGGPIPPPGDPPPRYEPSGEHQLQEALLPPSYDEATAGGESA